MTRVSGSLAAANLLNIREELEVLQSIPIDSLHYDIEDGSFTPVMSLGFNLLDALDDFCTLPINVHLMIHNPEWIIPYLPNQKVAQVSVHYEACSYPRRTLRKLHERGFSPGLAFNLSTPIPELDFLIPYLRFVLVLSNDPEEPNSPFVPSALKKIANGKLLNKAQDLEWVIDGGINATNILEINESGIESCVIGRALFCGNDIRKNYDNILNASSAKPFDNSNSH
jgi:ribulose-phosphate 3-epimerase